MLFLTCDRKGCELRNSFFHKLKGLDIWRIILLLLCFVIVMIRIISIFAFGEIDRQYSHYDGYTFNESTMLDCRNLSQIFRCEEERLNSIELMFDNIAEDKHGSIIISFFVNDELLYKSNLSLNADITKRYGYRRSCYGFAQIAQIGRNARFAQI